MTHVAALPGNPYDGHTLATVIPAGLAMRAHSFGKKVVDSASGVLRVIENSQVLVHTVPALMARATLCARSTSFVKIEAARPKMVAFARVIASSSVAKVSKPSTGPNISANHSPGPANPLPWLHCARALTPLRLAEIALARIRPSAPIVIKDFAEFVEHFCFNPDTPAGKSFACGSGRAFLFPSSTHRGNFEQVRPLNFRFRHNLECC